MTRLVALMDAKKRDAHVALVHPRRPAPPRHQGPNGAPVRLEKLVRSTVDTDHAALARRLGSPEQIAAALAASDPEVPLEVLGRPLGDASRVYLRQDGSMLGLAHLLEVVHGPDGAERSSQEFVDVEATVAEDGPPLAWTGRLIPIDEAVRKFAFTRKVQLQHVSGLTYEFLFEIARTLGEANKLLLVGAGPKGNQPLIFGVNGAPYRGFLEGRVEGEAYRLVLHLSNLELKSAAGGVP